LEQVQQNYGTGETSVEEVAIPALLPHGLLVANAFSLLSSGTERATTGIARRGLLGKALRRPDLVRKVLGALRREGLSETLRLVRTRLDQPAPLGYSSAGIVVAVADGVTEFRVGERVACAGQGYASHAGVVFCPRNLAAPVPEGVALEEAAFGALGAIALQGVRQSGAAVGETAVVIGLGLIGLLSLQILRACGCRVIGVDLDPVRVALAKRLGADEAVPRDGGVEAAVAALTSGAGADRVLLTAATPGNDPVELAATVARERAVVAVVGDVGLAIPREPFYRKELELRMSKSTGPGRYDPAYEERGLDYPLAHVRWTENRNLRAFLELLRDRKVATEPLVTHRFPLDRAAEAYEALRGGALGVLFSIAERHRRPLPPRPPSPAPPPVSRVGVAFLGAGAFAQSHLLPHARAFGAADLRTVVCATGLKAEHARARYGFRSGGTDPRAAIEDPSVQAVFIATRHDSHAELAAAALRAGKRVFLEKPVALTEAALREVEEAARAAGGGRLTVGFNRRFAPATAELRALLAGRRGPLVLQCRVDAGPLPRESWVLDPAAGGGRIRSEVCHFVDLLGFLAGERVERVHAAGARGGEPETVAVTLEMSGGSLGVLTYVTAATGGRRKELIEVFGTGIAARLDGFRAGGKGHAEEVRAFLDAVHRGEPSPVPEEEAFHATRAVFAILQSLRDAEPVRLLP
jgi:polar amino acid transport system substrate-binding protein